MTLNPTAWFVRWFFFSCRLIDHFCLTQSQRWMNGREDKYQDGTNLCHYVRTSMWGILIFSMIFGLYAYGFFVLFILPFITFAAYSILEVAIFIAGCLAALACGVGVLWGLGWCVFKSFDAIKEWRELHPKPIKKKEPGLGHLLWTYYRAVKLRICPLIDFQTKMGVHVAMAEESADDIS